MGDYVNTLLYENWDIVMSEFNRILRKSGHLVFSVLDSGFVIENLLEPMPTKQFKIEQCEGLNHFHIHVIARYKDAPR